MSNFGWTFFGGGAFDLRLPILFSFLKKYYFSSCVRLVNVFSFFVVVLKSVLVLRSKSEYKAYVVLMSKFALFLGCPSNQKFFHFRFFGPSSIFFPSSSFGYSSDIVK